MRRLIIFILIFALFLAFIILNIDNKCDVSLGFRIFKDVPVFISVFLSFVLGMIFAVPLIFSVRRTRKYSSSASSDSKWKKSKGKNRNNNRGDTYPKEGGGSSNTDYSKEYYGID